MTVAIACNLSEGVILAVDSAVSIPGSAGEIIKVYENAEKLFQVGDRPIGAATFGLGVLGQRTIGSFIREFELKNPNNAVVGASTMAQVVEELRGFLMTNYMNLVVPELEAATGKDFADIPAGDRPTLGVVVGGFSSNEYLAEVWEILIPVHDQPDSASRRRQQGEFGTNWFAICDPVRRYIKGFEPSLISEVVSYLEGLMGRELTDPEGQHVRGILGKYEYSIPYPAMPLEEGVIHARFLVELVINHHRFVIGAPVVGGKVQVGKVSYRGERFQIA